MLAIDDVNGDKGKMQVFDPNGNALAIRLNNSICSKEDIFVDDGGKYQYYPFVMQEGYRLLVTLHHIHSLEVRTMQVI